MSERPKKLYRATIELEVFVVGESEVDAISVATENYADILRNESDDADINASLAKSAPPDWHRAYPYGDPSKRVAEYLEEMPAPTHGKEGL